jgi:signal transduction histidine kinase
VPEIGVGIFDTPPDRKEIRLSFVVVGLLLIAFCVTVPFSDVRLKELPAFVPTIDAVMFVGDLIAATLLYAQGTLFRSRALLVLATAYLVSALLLVPHALTFPGSFSPTGLLGAGINTTAWIATFQRMTFPVGIILYVLLRQSETPPRIDRQGVPTGIAGWVLLAIFFAGSITLLATVRHDLLPPFYVNENTLIYSYAFTYQFVSFALLLGATAMLFRQRSSVLDLWLLVALAGWLIQSALIMTLHSRFTIGYYGLYLILLASHLVVLIALITESHRLYARLAVSTAARNMERDARLMSMDAVAATISHEVGQALAAISLNASVGIHSLEEGQPKIAKAEAAFRAIAESTQRSFDLIKSIRAGFAKKPQWGTEFNLNDMIRETAALLERELASAGISLHLLLDDSMPALTANRIELQQVLVNLIKNAIESPARTGDRPRSMAIASHELDEDILLQLSDDGIGVPPEEVPHMFDALPNAKSARVGVGLALCKAIVEEHGGRIWASRGDRRGVIFHVRIPRTSPSLPRHLLASND